MLVNSLKEAEYCRYAHRWLERAYSEPDPWLREMKSEPLLNSLRKDPRYAALLKKIGLPL